MKIDPRRLFTYPMLAEDRDDYKTCKFFAEMTPAFDAANNLVVNLNFSTDCPEINQLITVGDAEYLFHVECPTTIYREIFTHGTENFSCKIPRGNLKKEMHCVAMIVLRRDLRNFFCADWSDDFGRIKFDLQKGAVLAYKNLPTIVIHDDPNIFKNVASIFNVYKKAVDDEPAEIKLASDKIKIGLNAKDYLLYRRYCSRTELQPILNAMIIFPALVYVFDELKVEGNFETYSDKAWLKSLAAAYRREKIQLMDHVCAEENDSFKLAQEVMKLPISRALENISLVCDDAAEDS